MSYKYFQNKECEFFPCHKIEDQNCLFCFCPLYSLECGGDFILEKGVKYCDRCVFNHIPENYDMIIVLLKWHYGIST